MTAGVSWLIAQQVKTFTVMLCAGILTENVWRIKKRAQGRAASFAPWLAEELGFWLAAAVVLSYFLYYCDHGRLSVHAAIGFFAGLLLWKKICCGIIIPWAKDDEAQNSKTTVRSSTWRRPDSSDWREGKRKEKGKKKRPSFPRNDRREDRWLSEGAETDGDF